MYHLYNDRLVAKKWKDTDIAKDVQVVFDTVTRKISELSSFEMYVTELETKNLRWTPVHTEQVSASYLPHHSPININQSTNISIVEFIGRVGWVFVMS
jgi:hypothetical protein